MVTRGYVSLLTSGKKEISQRVMNKIIAAFPKVNIHWLLTGEGEPLSIGNNYQIDTGSSRENTATSMASVDALFFEVTKHYHPSLGVKQELTLRQACYRVLVDHPGAPMSALLIAAGVYLRFIEAYPNLSLPPEAGASAVVDPLPPGQ